MRDAAFAGQFYPATESAIRKQLEECFTGERGPGSLPPRKHDRKVSAVIVPHAGYQFSGACAAWAYHAIAATKQPDLFILLGPNHAAAKSATTAETWKTPLGLVRADQEFIKALAAKGSVKVDDGAMAREHSIEVQLPLLQFSVGDVEKLKIAPIMVSHDTDLQQLALDLKETLVELGRTATIIVSSDFTHHGPDYHYVRFNKEKAENIYKFDAQMIDLIKAQKGDEFLAFAEKELATVCGTIPIALLLRMLKPSIVKLEQYYTSGDIAGDYKNSVSYAAIVFEEKGK
jgi:MEMO1 family protein